MDDKEKDGRQEPEEDRLEGAPSGDESRAPPSDERSGLPGDAGPSPLARPSRRVGGKGVRDLAPQLFLIPLLLVVIGTLIVLFFRSFAADQRTVSQILRDMQGAGPHARQQDAFQLAQLVNERSRDGEMRHLSSEETGLVIELLDEHPDDVFLRKYLVWVLGSGQPAQSLPVLERVVGDASRPDEERNFARTALGLTRSPVAVDPLLQDLRSLEGREAWTSRTLSIQALAQIVKARPSDVPRARIAEAFRRHLGDPQREVAWNTAYYLAEYLDDPAGVPILKRLLDIDFLDGQEGDRPLSDEEKELWMVQAIDGVYEFDEDALRERLPEIRAVARERSWAKLLNAVYEHQELLEGEPTSASEAAVEALSAVAATSADPSRRTTTGAAASVPRRWK